LRGAEAITLNLKGGPVTVRFRAPEADKPGVFGVMQQSKPVFGRVHAREDIARVTGIALGDFDHALPIQTVSTGLPFCIVPLHSVAAVERLAIPQAATQAYLAGTDAKFFYVFARAAANSGADFHARMQFYNGEDPATGSASGCAISYMVKHGLVRSGVETVLEQGIEMRRPSRIFVSAVLTEGEEERVFVGGRTISVASGRFSLL
jgi:trans-2,3-dihydro-3-hydroxyanthranilate isomerase